MRRRNIVSLLIFLLALWPVMASAQQKIAVDDAQKHKLSLTTRMFISELNDGGFDPVQQMARRRARRAKSGLPVISESVTKHRSKNEGRFYAAPDTINGRAYVSAFIRLDDSNNTSAIEALGVQVQCRFKNGLITSNIPVDKLNEIIELYDVKNIEVATVMKPCTDKVRQFTNVDDVLNTSYLIRNGIDTKFDGSGVLLGVIDRGIDFTHIAFKDKDNNSRIRRAYIYNGVSEHEYDLANYTLITDNSNEDHGTHTASIAGGSSVIINGNTIEITDEHDKASYGGMAPGADLYLCGINNLLTTYSANAIQKICNYADNEGMPVVINNSWGGNFGGHNGRTIFSEIIDTYFKDVPNHICLFASGNNAGKSKDNEGGGCHIKETASRENPLRTIIRKNVPGENCDAGFEYSDEILYASTRNSCAGGLCFKVLVLDSKTGEILTTTPEMTNGSGKVEGIEHYYAGELQYLCENDVIQLMTSEDSPLITNSLRVNNGSTNKISNYTLAIELYPNEGSSIIDLWGSDYVYFTNHLVNSWVSGSDDMSVTNESMMSNIISVGSYISKNYWKDHNGNTQPYNIKIGDIAKYSGYATKEQSPTQIVYPWITAPGSFVVSAVNHFNTDGMYLNDDSWLRINDNTIYPYGVMEGTSMATPVVAGIVALWLQAAKELGMSLTTSDVKEIMAKTAIKDSYVTGTNSSHFGNGKIDALAGLAEILERGRKPMIQTTPSELSFDGPVNEQQSQKVNIKGIYIKGNISVTLTDESGAFSIDKTSIAASTEGVDITVSWLPTEAGTTTATLTLSAEGVDDVVINLTGHSEVTTIAASIPRVVLSTRVGTEYSHLFRVLGRYLTDDITLSISGDNDAFYVTPTTIYQNSSGKPIDVVVTFAPSSAGNYSGVLSIMSNGAETASIILNGTGTDGVTELSKYEYWFDNDLSNITSGSLSGYEADIDVNVNTQHLSDGLHTVNIRVKQSGGEYDYSPLTTKVFFKHNKAEGGQIVYWFDDNDIDSKAGSTSILEIEEPQLVTLDLSDNDKFPLGLHTLKMRMATRGKSLGSISTAHVLKTATGDFNRIEYWVDDKFPSQASQRGYVTASSSSGKEFNFENKTFNLGSVPSGPHRVYYRAVSSNGTTGSAVGMASVFVGGGTPSMIEYWFDGDATKSTTVPLPASALQDTIDVALVMSDAEKFPLGFHQLNMRMVTDSREQSPLYTARVLKTSSGKADRIEYWVDDWVNEDGERSNVRTVTGQIASDDNCYIFNDPFDLSDVSAGLHCLYYRAASSKGLTNSAVSMIPVLVGGGNINKLEYWFDDENSSSDVRVLSANTGSDGVTYFNQTVNLDDLSSGVHRLYYRGVNDEGESRTAVSMTPVLVKSLFKTDGDAVLSTFSIGVDDETIELGPLNGEDEQLFTYTLDATELSLGNHTLKASFWNSYGMGITEQIPFLVVEPLYYIKGDVNADGDVDLVDVVAMINSILGKPSSTFIVEAADMNDDGEVDIFDVMKAINLVLNNSTTARNKARETSDTEELAFATPTADGILVGVHDASRFTAFQFDVEVADDMELTEARLTSDAAHHTLRFVKNGQNSYRVVGVSMSNSALTANGNGLIELSFSKGGRVQISNIFFVTPQESKVHFVCGDAVVTGIDSIENKETEEIFDLSGRKVDSDRSRLPKGVYIINKKKRVIK